MDPLRLSLFHTNDIHGRLGALARLSHFARRLRAEAQAEGRTAFFWDAGDAADRRIRICSLTKGAAFAPILSAAGYSLLTMGNAISLPYGPQAMAAVAARAAFPILAANCRDGDGPLPEGLREQALFPLPHGLMMGVIGLTAPWGDFYEIFGLRFPDFREVARRLVTRMREEGVSPVVVLSHLGLEDDRRLADEVAGIDLIVGAHSHDRLPHGEERNGVLIAQAGEYGEALGRVDLTLDPATGRVLERSARVLDVPADEPADPLVTAAIEAAEREVAKITARPVGVLEAPLDLDHFHECGIGNLAADAIRERMGAEAALLAGGLFHQDLAAGAITLGQLDAACFSTANPYLSDVSGAQILAALERGLTPSVAEARHHWFRGTPMGLPQISGMIVEYDPAAEAGRRVRRVSVQGEHLDPQGRYRLAHTDAETIPEIGYLQLDEDQVIRFEVPTILREVIEDYLRQHSPLPAPGRGRWRPVTPARPSRAAG